MWLIEITITIEWCDVVFKTSFISIPISCRTDNIHHNIFKYFSHSNQCYILVMILSGQKYNTYVSWKVWRTIVGDFL